MGTKVTYKMIGFSSKLNVNNSKQEYQTELKNNTSYIYKNHPFLEKVYINDFLTRITFFLKSGKKYSDYKEEIIIELERICFNLIIHPDIHTNQPICSIDMVLNEEGKEINRMYDSIVITEELEVKVQIPAEDLYKKILEKDVKIKEFYHIYKELFHILHSPYRVIQFIGLYDIMADLINPNGNQRDVYKYFEENADKYDWNKMTPSRKNPNNLEDSLTYLRNGIAHSRRSTMEKYRKVCESVGETHIKRLLIVINDLLISNNRL